MMSRHVLPPSRIRDETRPRVVALCVLCLVWASCASAPEGAADRPGTDTLIGEQETVGGPVDASREPDAPVMEEDGEPVTVKDGAETNGPPAEDGAGDTPSAPPGEVTSDGDGAPAASSQIWIVGATLAGGGPSTVILSEGLITHVLQEPSGQAPPEGATVLDYSGAWLAPTFIDSHVHVIYLPAAQALLAGGVVGAVDHGAPLSFFQQSFGALRVRGSGPMVTAIGGYPTQSWGANGYGMECGSTEDALEAVDGLHALGASFIKVPLAGAPQLTDSTIAAVVDRAHDLGLKVSVHALSAETAARAGASGADILAHTPTEVLDPGILDTWGDRAVVSTLSAFGGSADAVNNLAALHDRGAVVLYGTDLGNTSLAAIQPTEIALLMSAGLTGAEILVAGTSAPAAWWGFEDLGAVAPGKSANLLVLAADPLEDPMTLTEPVQVLVDGEPLTP